MGLSVEHVPKFCREFIRQARFRKKGCETVTLRTFPQGSLNEAAHRNNGNIACAGVPSQIVEKLPAIAVRHRQIRHDNVRVYLPRMAKGFSTICDRDDLETRRRKRKGIEHARVLVPLDDEDERSRRRVSRAAAVHDRMP